MTTFDVTNLNDSGAGSLRAAINAANAQPVGSPSTIDFTVAGTITLASALPSIDRTVTIDATTAPGYAAGAPVVELNCNSNAGLVFALGSGSSQLLGMAVDNASGNGVTLNAGSITVAGDYIGVNLAGTAFGNGGDGVYVAATSSNNLIGLNPTAASGVVSNVISGNGGNGISLQGSSGNTLVNNYIGTDPTGTVAVANGANGIWVTAGSNGNEIGGTAYIDTTTGAVNDPTGTKGTVPEVYVVPPLGNLVSGNTQNGILIDANSQNNVLNGNFVGTAANGDSAIGNGLDGVAISGADNNSLIGCSVVDNPFIYYNVLSGNGGNGLHITNSNDITVQANFFGIGADNTTVVGNAANGILVDGSSTNVQVGGVIPLGNVAAGNGLNGIEVTDTVSGFTTFNTFGGLLAFKGAAPNGNDGLLITATGGNQTVQTNVFSGNTNNGIEIGGDASGVTVDPNIVGMTTNGGTILANGGDGLLIDGTAHANIIGGYQASVIPQNVFSGNVGYGVAITGQAYDNQVFNSYIGVQTLGVEAAGNQAGGVYIGDTATGNVIGGLGGTPSQPVADVISGNGGNGITLGSASSTTLILYNTIGFGVDGILPVPNAGASIVVNGSTGNVIVGNTVSCFAAGTRIATAEGEMAVETLAAGDLATTAAHGDRPITWIGHRRIDCRRHPKPEDVWPVHVLPGAMADGLPCRDLWLSPDHAVFMDGVLIPIRYLINGRTVVQEPRDWVTYYHVELATHDILRAEGLACESFLDTGNKADFDNSGTVVRLQPAFAMHVWGTEACAPLVLGGVDLQAARSFVMWRAEQLGHATTSEPGLRLCVDGENLRPEVDGTRHRFHVPATARDVYLMSRSGVPAQVREDSGDHRRLGVAVGAMTYGGTDMPLEDSRLGRGWHTAECEAGVSWRWNDGCARIELVGGQDLDIEVALTERYWLEPARRDVGLMRSA